MIKNVIFITDLTLWSMGLGNGGPAFTKTVQEYINRGCNVWIVSDVESNRKFPDLSSENNIVVNVSRYKKYISKRKIGCLFRVLDHLAITSKFEETVCSIIDNNQYTGEDTVIYAYEVYGVKAAKEISSKRQIPFVTRFQGTILAPYKNSIINRIRFYPHFQAIEQNSDLVIMTDDGTQGDQVIKRLKNSSSNILFIRNGLDLLSADVLKIKSSFDRDKFRKQFSANEETVFLTVSRLVKWKRVDRAINGFADYCNKGGNGKLIIVGDGDSKEALFELCKERKIENRVVFTGAVKHEDVYSYMMACDIFLSLYDLSNVGNPLLEAMTLGKPIITLDVGDTKKVITDGYNGRLISVEELESLGDVLKELADNKQLQLSLGNNAAEYARENLYSWAERMNLEYTEAEGILKRPEGK